MENLNLVPPLVQSGHVHELIALGQTVSASLSPLDNSLAAFITNTVRVFVGFIGHISSLQLRRSLAHLNVILNHNQYTLQA